MKQEMFGIASGSQRVPSQYSMLVINFFFGSYCLFLESDSGFCYSNDIESPTYYIYLRFKGLFKEKY